jgi:hypothetical protein
MPLAPIDPRTELHRVDRIGRALLSLGAICFVLVGCSSGLAQESRRDQSRDAGLQDQLVKEQATRTAQRYFPATGTPSPTKPPAPGLHEIAITFGFRADGMPDGSYASVPAGAGTAYVAARLSGLASGEVVRAVVIDAWGNEFSAPEEKIAGGAADRWLALPIALPAELAPGAYGAYVVVDDRPLGSVAFSVTGVGTSAQLFPEPPANPQVRATLPPPGAMPTQGAPTPTVAPSA